MAQWHKRGERSQVTHVGSGVRCAVADGDVHDAGLRIALDAARNAIGGKLRAG